MPRPVAAGSPFFGGCSIAARRAKGATSESLDRAEAPRRQSSGKMGGKKQQRDLYSQLLCCTSAPICRPCFILVYAPRSCHHCLDRREMEQKRSASRGGGRVSPRQAQAPSQSIPLTRRRGESGCEILALASASPACAPLACVWPHHLPLCFPMASAVEHIEGGLCSAAARPISPRSLAPRLRRTQRSSSLAATFSGTSTRIAASPSLARSLRVASTPASR